LVGSKLVRIVFNLAIVIIFAFSSLAASAAVHKIKPGDTLWTIAKKYHTTPQAIARANRISENAILGIGKTLYIPVKTAASCNNKSQHQKSSVIRTRSSRYATVLTIKDNVCVRSGPGTDHKKIATLRQGTALKALYRSGNWLKVTLQDGRCGYVYRPLVDIARTPGKPTEQPTYSEEEQSPDRSSIVQTALAYRGARYRRGGTSRGGFDCSGFTRYVFAKYGIILPHSSAAQARIGKPVGRHELQPGDLVFFQTYRRGISHVGIYIGNGQFVHASTHRRGVTVDSLNSPYYAPRYRGARRVR
jgi:cell wall-associated NlpC family hydrolase